MNFGFNVMQERDDYKELYELERAKNKELENKVKEKSEK